MLINYFACGPPITFHDIFIIDILHTAVGVYVTFSCARIIRHANLIIYHLLLLTTSASIDAISVLHRFLLLFLLIRFDCP